MLVGAYDQGLPSSIYGQNMRPNDLSLGTFYLVAELFVTTVYYKACPIRSAFCPFKFLGRVLLPLSCSFLRLFAEN